MPVLDESEAFFKKWATLIKADKIGDVLAEVTVRNIAEEKALECLVYMSQLAYKDTQNGVAFRSPPEDILHLTRVLSSRVISRPSLCTLRFTSSLYHIAFFFYRNNHLMCLKQIYKIILETKRTNKNCFQGEGAKIYEYFILLLKKAIPDLIIKDCSKINKSIIKECLSLQLDLSKVENELGTGSLFLESVLYVSHMVAREDKKSAVYLICKGLELFDVKTIKDIDSSLTFVFKLLLSLFNHQLAVTGYASALDLVLSFVDRNKWKFGEENSLYGGCFFLICQAKMFLSSQSEVAVKKMIQKVNMILGNFENAREKKEFVKEACVLMLVLINNLKQSETITSSALLNTCLQPFLEMEINLCDAVKHSNIDMHFYIYYLSDCFWLVSEVGLEKKALLKECSQTLLETEHVLFEANHMLRSENHPKADCNTKVLLTRCANLLRTYHLALLKEEIIAISKPFCKFICTLPSYVLEDSSTKTLVDLGFTCLMQAMGPQQLYEVLEVAVAWLILSPKSSDKAFRLWGDIKHNAICAGGSEFLDTTVFHIVNEGKSSFEEKWLPCKLTPAQIGELLVEELNTYFTNSTLRGSAVLEAVQALESLALDLLTQVRGVVIALDVALARTEYAEQCSHYYDRSKQLLNKLKKQKNKIDPVIFNCCMAELLYGQFRFKLKAFRSDCEGEVLRLSALHESAGALIPELPEDQPDPDDTCDVTTRYNNLSLEKQRDVLGELNTAVTFWRTACTRLTSIDESKNANYDLRISLNNLQEAACIMKLYCDETKESELWHLLYTLAQLVNDPDKIIIAVGEMKSKNQAVVDNAEELLQQPEVSQKTKDRFALNKALFHLKKNEIAEGFKLLALKTEKRKNLSTINYVNSHIILGLYQKLSEWDTFSGQFLFSPSCHLSFHKALSNLLFLTQQEKWNSLMEASQIQLALLQVSQQLGEINCSLEQPREARCYLKSQLSVAQKLGLPLRSSQLLLLLAWVDLQTGMMADCAVKLEGLEALLDLQGAPTTYIAGTDRSTKLSKGEIWDPEFLSHLKLFPGCGCFACSCTEYQRLVLETLTLRATYLANNDQLSLALQNFKVALRVRNYLSNSDAPEVHISSAKLWKCYANTLILCNKPQEELNITEEAHNAIPSVERHPILRQHILHQNSCHLNFTACQNKPIGPRILIETEENSLAESTPLKKQPQVLPTKTPLSVVNGNITPKFVRRVRKLTLPSSGEENTPPPPKSSAKSTRHIKLPSKFKIETPHTTNKLPNVNKTPFTIVDDDGNAVGVVSSKASTRVKKKIETNTSTSVHKSLFGSDKISSGKKLTTPIFKSPERKSRRNLKSKVNEKSDLSKDDNWLKKPGPSQKNQDTNQKELEADSKLFLFDELKDEVNNIKCTLPKLTYVKNSSKRVQKAIGTRGHSGSSKVDVESDCSIVEGTPSPPGKKNTTLRTLKSKRTMPK